MGSVFRKWYGQVGHIRSFVPTSTPVVALTATATKETCALIVNHMQMTELHLVHLSPNDRPGGEGLAARLMTYLVSQARRSRRAGGTAAPARREHYDLSLGVGPNVKCGLDSWTHGLIP